MNLYTTVEQSVGLPQLSHADRILLMGSCFATHIGNRMLDAKFCCNVNPYGVLYNPLSILAALGEVEERKVYTAEDLFWHEGCWHSMMHHSDFSSPDVDEALARINTRLQAVQRAWDGLTVLLLTLGTAYVYEERESGRVAGNCHKLPETHFLRRRLSVEEIVQAYSAFFVRQFSVHPNLRVLFTVSPIRHVRDGLHQNALSKSVLLLAVDRLCSIFPNRVFYFPAYELLMDELRDYRFYAEDLVHPSLTAVGIVWERFVQACFSPETQRLMAECEKIYKMLNHRPFRPEGEEYKCFLEQIVLKIERLNEKCPYLDFENERNLCRTRLTKLQK